ncbi:linear gramicidin synthetase subunit C domain protein [Mycobacterium xenopi 4042]|uniref:Linear gramicidin synthetase subunit C domain protein n=1 Tax=Mycobacterium xenopi 4042 TaxID=1299334 RepID=X8CKI3_MYCXE|nr:linear gramicidin synthetase subunit C domain protein [Mycobacterium xenopi 4042]
MGLLINTVPCGAHHGQTTVAELLEQLQHVHNDTLEHQHLALSDIHRATATSNCSTPFRVRELSNRHRRLSGADGLASPSSPPANTTTTRCPWWRAGRELVLRVEFDTEVFDAPASRRSPSGCGGCWWR